MHAFMHSCLLTSKYSGLAGLSQRRVRVWAVTFGSESAGLPNEPCSTGECSRTVGQKDCDTPDVVLHTDHRSVHDHRMAQHGKPQRGHEPQYQVGCGRSYRPGIYLGPAEADRAVTAALSMGMSVSGLLTELIKRMDVDDVGRPTWWKPEEEVTDPLPLASGG